MQDSKALHFLKEFPAWLVLSALFAALLYVWYVSERAFLEHLIDTVMGGLLTLLIGRKVSAQTGNTTSGDVNIIPPSDDLKDLTTPEAIGAVENIGEGK